MTRLVFVFCLQMVVFVALWQPVSRCAPFHSTLIPLSPSSPSSSSHTLTFTYPDPFTHLEIYRKNHECIDQITASSFYANLAICVHCGATMKLYSECYPNCFENSIFEKCFKHYFNGSGDAEERWFRKQHLIQKNMISIV